MKRDRVSGHVRRGDDRYGPAAAGVLTPATGIGCTLARRLRATGFDIRTERAVWPDV